MLEQLLLVESKPKVYILDSGAGPQYLKKGDINQGYFGSIPNDQFFSQAELLTAGPNTLTVGTPSNTGITNVWQKYVFNGKILFIPKVTIRNGVSWNALYDAGLVYGEDGNGNYPAATPVKQTAMLRMKDDLNRMRYYRVRLVRSNVTDPTTSLAGTSSDVRDSEYSCTVERTIPTTGQTNIWGSNGVITTAAAALNTDSALTTRSITFGSTLTTGSRTQTSKGTAGGWLPCLELMPLDYDPTPEVDWTGPGPTSMVDYFKGAGYFGTLTEAEFVTRSEIEAVASTPLDGTVANEGSRVWNKYLYGDKVLFIPTKVMRTGISWDKIYAAGFVYGEDGVGAYPSAAGSVNQACYVIKTFGGKEHWFRVRLIRASVIDASSTSAVSDSYNVRDSEYTCTVERTYPTSGNPVAWGTFGNPGGVVATMTSRATSTEYLIAVNGNSNYGSRNYVLKNAATVGWLPVLELMPEGFNNNPIIPDNGPGVKTLAKYNAGTGSGYFGRVPADQLPSIATIEAAGAASVGGTSNPAATTAPWAKFVRGGKVFYYPTVAIRTNTNWNNIYNAGFVYGTDSNGKYPTGTPVNQRRTINFTDTDGVTWQFLIRLASLTSVDPYSHTASAPQAAASEYGQAIQNMYSGSPLAWDTFARPDVLGIETNGTYNTSGAMSATTFNAVSNWPKDGGAGGKGWFPVLELIGKVT